MERAYFLLFLIILLMSCQNAITEINEPILPEVDVASAKELVDICSNYIVSLWGSDDYYVGKVFMHFNQDMKGYVDITFATNSRREPPKLALIRLDTKERTILYNHRLPRADKMYPGRFKLTEWKVDSPAVLDLAKQRFGDRILSCDRIVLSTFLYEVENEYEGV